MTAFFAWLETTAVATAVRDSLMVTGVLSAVHLLGFTLVMGSAFASNLRLLGAVFGGRPVRAVAIPAGRALVAGLCLSVATGLLLFAPRASAASANRTFQIKMLLLVTAALVQLLVYRRVVRGPSESAETMRVAGAAGLSLWTALALAGCAFILFE